MALLADAGHNLSDVFGLLAAFGAATLAKEALTSRYTYGLRASSNVAALANAILLMIAVGAIAWEAVQRFFYPEPVVGATVMIVAAIGIAINGFTARLFMAGRDEDIIIRGARLPAYGVRCRHLVGCRCGGRRPSVDRLSLVGPTRQPTHFRHNCLGNLVTAARKCRSGLARGTSGNRSSQGMCLPSKPPRCFQDPGLHIWPMSTTENARTCHFVMPGNPPGDAFLNKTAHTLKERFKIAHATF